MGKKKQFTQLIGVKWTCKYIIRLKKKQIIRVRQQQQIR